jgi:hypothetical protein
MASVSQMRWNNASIHRILHNPSTFCHDNGKQCLGDSTWEAVLHYFRRINQHWKNIETSLTYCITPQLRSLLDVAMRWHQPDVCLFVLWFFSGCCTIVCEVSSTLKVLESAILFSPTVFSNTSKIVFTTFLNLETQASYVSSCCKLKFVMMLHEVREPHFPS